MADVSERLSEVCKLKKIKNIDLVNLNCGSAQTVSFVLNGKQKPNCDFLRIFLNEFLDVNARWLLTGKGNMFMSNENVYLTDVNSREVGEPRKYLDECKSCILSTGEINRLEKDREGLLDRLESQSEEIGRLKGTVDKRD